MLPYIPAPSHSLAGAAAGGSTFINPVTCTSHRRPHVSRSSLPYATTKHHIRSFLQRHNRLRNLPNAGHGPTPRRLIPRIQE
ncbi:hypothetical protein E2C01_068676 [Portunus trituberculatus]|uniref:Uncharacterized protein n=1 Tax=Portunus trituberculatus TaxID=210409 RepID=A0A5B7HX29_PORTR|nr:hypothetical protein [Portunus trituberculatus]